MSGARGPVPYEALPPYLGGKRRLAPLIFAVLAEARPRACWPSLAFLDPCCGGGAVALTAKAHGLRVTASDRAARAAVVARALIANSDVRLSRADCLAAAQAPIVAGPAAARGVFAPAQATLLDRGLAYAADQAEPRRSLLQLVWITLALRAFPISLPAATDAAAAAAGDWDRLSPRRVGHYLRAQRRVTPDDGWQIAQGINRGVLPGSGAAAQTDARTALAAFAGDVCYLDPPYPGTTGYRDSYAVIDALLGDPAPPAPAPDLDALLDAARAIPLLLLSYGGPAITLDQVVAQVARHRPVLRALEVPYPHLPALATKESAHAAREYLVCAGR